MFLATSSLEDDSNQHFILALKYIMQLSCPLQSKPATDEASVLRSEEKGNTGSVKKEKAVPPQPTQPKKLSKKQLLAEQQRREKVMYNIL